MIVLLWSSSSTPKVLSVPFFFFFFFLFIAVLFFCCRLMLRTPKAYNYIDYIPWIFCSVDLGGLLNGKETVLLWLCLPGKLRTIYKFCIDLQGSIYSHLIRHCCCCCCCEETTFTMRRSFQCSIYCMLMMVMGTEQQNGIRTYKAQSSTTIPRSMVEETRRRSNRTSVIFSV